MTATKTTVLLVMVCLAAAGRCWADEAADKVGTWVQGAEQKANEDGDSWTGWALNKLSE